MFWDKKTGVTMVTTKSVYDKIGGKGAIKAVVSEFYIRVLSDPLLAPLFVGVDMKRQHDHQIAFLTFALNGSDSYTGNSMRDAHKGLGITTEHFQAVAGHLQSTLVDAQVQPAEIEIIMATAASLHDDIVEA
jgi:hemoglobin